MTDNPFNSPGAEKETIFVRPTPGGQAAAPSAPLAPPAPFAPSAPATPSASPGYPGHDQQPARPMFQPLPSGPVDLPKIGWPPLLEAAAPLLLLLAQLRNTFAPPDPMGLRQQLVGELQRFDAAARDAGVQQDTIYWARYALCASIDDLVLNTEWGNNSAWIRASLGSTYFQDVVSGEKFFQLLDATKRDAARSIDLLTLMYFCLALGYQGQYRLVRRGTAELEQLREEIYGILKNLRPPRDLALSLHWAGIAAPYRAARTELPMWVIAATTALLLVLIWVGLRALVLDRASSGPFAQAEQSMPHDMPGIERPKMIVERPPPKREQPDFNRRLGFLEPEIRQHKVAVDSNGASTRITIFDTGGALFASGSADLNPEYDALLTRIGQAIQDEPGQVTVNGHTDAQPLRPLNKGHFAGNYELSVARARAAEDIVAVPIRDKSRLNEPVGFAATHPVCTTDQTDECRARNRRVEIILTRPPS